MSWLHYCLFCREDQVNFRGFMRTLAHFRPIEDNEKNKNAAVSEPLNSRTNKLLCESLLALSPGACPGEPMTTITHTRGLSCCDWHMYFYFSSCFPSVWPGQRWQNLPWWAAAGELIGLSCEIHLLRRHADNEAISNINNSFICPRHTNILYLCYLLSLWGHLGLIWGLNISDKSLV